MPIIEVNKNGKIKTINEALELVNEPNTKIMIAPGIYQEKIKITHDDLELIGTNTDQTLIVNDDYAKKIHCDGQEFNTFRTYTVMILANNVKISNLTIKNSSGYGNEIGQAVALSIIGDKIELDHVTLDAYQDTLFVGPLPDDLIDRYQNFLPKDELISPKNHRIFIHDSLIKGDVDFIFGSGNCVLQNCTIFSYERKGYVVAPSTNSNDEYGFTFIDCYFTSLDLTPRVYLARPWRDYGKVVIINSKMDEHILTDGWNKWNDTERDKTCRFYEYHNEYLSLKTYKRIYFGHQLSENELPNYSLEMIFKEK